MYSKYKTKKIKSLLNSVFKGSNSIAIGWLLCHSQRMIVIGEEDALKIVWEVPAVSIPFHPILPSNNTMGDAALVSAFCYIMDYLQLGFGEYLFGRGFIVEGFFLKRRWQIESALLRKWSA